MLAATAMKAVDELEFAKGATKTGDRGTNSRKAQDALDELGLDSVLGSVALGRTDEVREVIAAKGEFTQHPDSVDYAFRAEKRGGPTSTALGGVEAQPKAASTSASRLKKRYGGCRWPQRCCQHAQGRTDGVAA